MKIVIINHRFYISGGPETYMFNLIKLLETNNHIVIPFSIKSKRNVNTIYEKYFCNPVGNQDISLYNKYKKNIRTILSVIVRQFYSLHVKNKLIKLIKTEKPDAAIVLNHSNKLSSSVVDACEKYGLKTIVRLSDYFLACPQAHLFLEDSKCLLCISRKIKYPCVLYSCIKKSKLASTVKVLSNYFNRVLTNIYQKVDYYVCTNEYMKNIMIKDGISKSKLKVINTFTLKEQQAGDSDNTILYFGRFAKEKGVDALVSAYVNSKVLRNKTMLILIGGKAEDLVCKDLVDEFNDSIMILPFMASEKLENYIKRCLFVVNPSKWVENMPNTIIEAYSFGKPIIAPNMGCFPEFIKNEKTGLLYEPYDNKDLQFKMEKLYYMINSGHKYIENIISEFKKYDADRHYRKLMELLED